MGLLKQKKYEAPTEAYKPEVVEAPKAVEAPSVDGCQTPVDGKPCGLPLAPGQTYVCNTHVRAN